MEIERKFTVKQLPEHLEDYPCRRLEQGYLYPYFYYRNIASPHDDAVLRRF